MGPLRSLLSESKEMMAKADKTLDMAQKTLSTVQNLLDKVISGKWVPKIDTFVILKGETMDVKSTVTLELAKPPKK